MKIKFLLLLLCIGCYSSSIAQDDDVIVDVPIDSTVVDKNKKQKKIKVPYRPKLTGIKIGTDLYPIAFTFFEQDFTGYDFNSELVFNNRFFLNFDYGTQDAKREDDDQTFLYTNKGNFWRVGIDYNFMHNQFPSDALFVGVRFGRASFDHQVSYTSTNTIWEDQAKTITLNGLNSSWAELNFGMKIKVIGNLHLSAILRGKFRLSVPDESLFTVSEMPGFGINRNSVTGAIGYRISYMIPMQKSTKKSPKLKSKGEKKVKSDTKSTAAEEDE